MTTTTITIDIWSDVACPWCFIGKRRLESALSEFQHSDQVEIEYHSFELSPDTPKDFVGSTVEFLAKRKGMPVSQVNEMLQHVTQIADAEGLAYDFGLVKHVNTGLAHEFLHAAKAQGLQLQAKEALFSAYFERGLNISDAGSLVEIGNEIGMDTVDLAERLENGTFREAVQQDLSLASQIGISGVPFFVFQQKYALSGAQDSSVFLQALDQVWNEANQDGGLAQDSELYG